MTETSTVEIDGRPYPALLTKGWPEPGWIAVLPLETGLVVCVHNPPMTVIATTASGYDLLEDSWYLHLSEPFEQISSDADHPQPDPYCSGDYLNESEVRLVIAEWSSWSREVARSYYSDESAATDVRMMLFDGYA